MQYAIKEAKTILNKDKDIPVGCVIKCNNKIIASTDSFCRSLLSVPLAYILHAIANFSTNQYFWSTSTNRITLQPDAGTVDFVVIYNRACEILVSRGAFFVFAGVC